MDLNIFIRVSVAIKYLVTISWFLINNHKIVCQLTPLPALTTPSTVWKTIGILSSSIQIRIAPDVPGHGTLQITGAQQDG